MPIPLLWTTSCPASSSWSATFTLLNEDLTPMNITGKTFELVLRTSPRAATVSAQISTTSTGSGQITVNTVTSVIQAVFNASAITALDPGSTYALTLWMDPGLPDAEALVVGSFYVQPAAAP